MHEIRPQLRCIVPLGDGAAPGLENKVNSIISHLYLLSGDTLGRSDPSTRAKLPEKQAHQGRLPSHLINLSGIYKRAM
jgi:hypothetical protein